MRVAARVVGDPRASRVVGRARSSRPRVRRGAPRRARARGDVETNEKMTSTRARETTPPSSRPSVERTVERDVSRETSTSTLARDAPPTRLWTNVEPWEDGSAARRLRRRPGSTAAAIALVAGTTLGAGMLALPVALRDAGFVPSTAVIAACWAFFSATGLCVLEVNLGTTCELGRGGGVSVNAMTRRTLGESGVRVATASYAFIHYALLVAYVQKIGQLATETATDVPGGASGASVAYAAAMSLFLYFATPEKIEKFNSVLFVGVLGTFLPLLALAASSETTSIDNLLAVSDWSKTPATIPIIAVAFVYHQVIPVVATSLEGDKERATTAVLAGTAIPALMFILWNAAVLGSVPPDATSMGDPIAALEAASPATAALVRAFEFFAVSTSFLGFGWGLADFIADSMEMDASDARPWITALAPPVVFALTRPDVFLQALDGAGAFGVLVVFGMLPPAMVYRHRAMREECKRARGGEDDPVECLPILAPTLPGGSLMLAFLFALAAYEVGTETLGLLGAV